MRTLSMDRAGTAAACLWIAAGLACEDSTGERKR